MHTAHPARAAISTDGPTTGGPTGSTARPTAKLQALALFFGITLANSAIAENCGRVSAYWNTNMQDLVANISDCDQSAWQKCSQAAAIHYDLRFGSLGQRAESCGWSTASVPGRDYTAPQATDTQHCLSARDDLKDVFETRALARLACAAAREGGDDQEWLDSQCKLYRSQMSNYHLSFRTVAQHCEIDYEQLVATLDRRS